MAPDVLDDELVAIRVIDISAGQFSFQHQTDKIIMPFNAAAELLDMDIDDMGKSKKRKGRTLIANDVGANAVNGLVGFFPAGGSRQLLMESNGIVYVWTGSGNWVSSLTGLTAVSSTEFAIAKNLVFRLSQDDNIQSFDGSNWTEESNTGDVIEASFSGTGLDDLTSGGTFVGSTDITYKVIIDAIGDTDSITVFADGGSGQVVVTSVAHGLVDGQTVVITGTTNYNGTFVISNKTTDTFEITDTWVADDATGTWTTTDSFEWFKDNASQAAFVVITGAAQTLDLGVTVTFGATSGHTVNDRWSFDGIGTDNTNFPLALMALYTTTQRMAAANTSSKPNFLYFSNTADPQVWDRTFNAYRIGKNEGDGITGMLEFTNQEMIVFTKDTMTIVNISNSDVTKFTQAKVADIGCVAHKTVRQLGEDALFLSDDGVRGVLQSAQDKKRGASLPLSFPIQDWIQRINWAKVSNALAWVWQDKYYLSVPIDNATINSHVLVFSRRAFEANGNKGGWTVYTNTASNAFAVQNFNTTNKLYFGEAGADTKVYQFRSADPTDDGTSDNGTAITYSETGKAYDFDFPENDKTFEALEVEAIAGDGTLNVSAQIDENGFTDLGTISLASTTASLPVDLPFTLAGDTIIRKKFDLEQLGRGRSIQIKITEDTLNADVTKLKYSITAFVENIETEGA